ncbi:MAG TPA: hypothetical protein VMV18_07885 [bacterium]|nr:hypothetical protein [bacterium]
MKRAILLLTVLAAAACHHHAPTGAEAPDEAVLFARAAFEKLSAGDPAAAASIDWEALRGRTLDVGSVYRALGDDKERADFRAAFLANFAGTLREQGVASADYTGWRAEKKSTDAEVVTAASPKGSVHLTVAVRATGMKLVAIGP